MDAYDVRGAAIVFKQTGGGRVGTSFWWGGISASWPLMAFEVTAESLTLHFVSMPYEIPRDRVRSIRLVGPSWARGFHGVRVIHDAPRIPQYVLFWSFDREPVVAALRDHGFEVES